MSGQRFLLILQIAPAVAVIEKAGEAIVAALNDVLRLVGQFKSGLVGHTRSLTALASQLHRLWRASVSEMSGWELIEVNLAPLVISIIHGHPQLRCHPALTKPRESMKLLLDTERASVCLQCR